VDGLAISCHSGNVYDQSPTGRRIGPGLITFLAVLALAAGTSSYIGTRSVLTGSGTPSAQGNSGGSGSGRTTTPPANSGSNQGSGPQGTGASSPPNTATPTVTQVPPGDPHNCPQPTVDAIAQAGLDSNLSVQLYVRVHRAGEFDSEIWICKNATGELIYQGHVMSGPLDLADNAVNTLLLADNIKGTVQLDGTDGYVASNPNNGVTTEYHVSPLQLVQIKEPGDLDRQVYPAVAAYQP
jgi:hypothetical protein